MTTTAPTESPTPDDIRDQIRQLADARESLTGSAKGAVTKRIKDLEAQLETDAAPEEDAAEEEAPDNVVSIGISYKPYHALYSAALDNHPLRDRLVPDDISFLRDDVAKDLWEIYEASEKTDDDWDAMCNSFRRELAAMSRRYRVEPLAPTEPEPVDEPDPVVGDIESARETLEVDGVELRTAAIAAAGKAIGYEVLKDAIAADLWALRQADRLDGGVTTNDIARLGEDIVDRNLLKGWRGERWNQGRFATGALLKAMQKRMEEFEQEADAEDG
jgi:hypothetical protein